MPVPDKIQLQCSGTVEGAIQQRLQTPKVFGRANDDADQIIRARPYRRGWPILLLFFSLVRSQVQLLLLLLDPLLQGCDGSVQGGAFGGAVQELVEEALHQVLEPLLARKDGVRERGNAGTGSECLTAEGLTDRIDGPAERVAVDRRQEAVIRSARALEIFLRADDRVLQLEERTAHAEEPGG
jgi:hypothetical protein